MPEDDQPQAPQTQPTPTNETKPPSDVTISLFDRNVLTFGRDFISTDTKKAQSAIETVF